MEKNAFYFFYVFISSILITVKSWQVTCDVKGECLIYIQELNQTLDIGPGIMSLLPEKNVVPIKNSSNSIAPTYQVTSQSTGRPYEGYLVGSQYECADGIGECFDSCCFRGLCSDPSYLCLHDQQLVNLIIMILGLIYLFLIIAYWILFYLFGVWNNAMPPEEKENPKYIKFIPNSMNQKNKNSDGNAINSDERNPEMIQNINEIPNEIHNFDNYASPKVDEIGIDYNNDNNVPNLQMRNENETDKQIVDYPKENNKLKQPSYYKKNVHKFQRDFTNIPQNYNTPDTHIMDNFKEEEINN